MIVVVAALKGGVGKTTTSVYLAALATSNRRSATLIDADPQASAAEWVDPSLEERFQRVDVVEAPTDRLLNKALDRLSPEEVAIVDTPPGNERLLGKALDRATVVVIPTRAGGVEASRAEAVHDMVPDGTPVGIVLCSARSFTISYRDTLDTWTEAGVPVWGTIPERVAISAGPIAPLSLDGIDAYRRVWRRVQSAARSAAG